MLNVRTGIALDTDARALAGDLARAIAAHPLANHLSGTVIIGTGGAHKHAPQHVVAAPHAQPKAKPPTSVAGWRIDITRVR